MSIRCRYWGRKQYLGGPKLVNRTRATEIRHDQLRWINDLQQHILGFDVEEDKTLTMYMLGTR